MTIEAANALVAELPTLPGFYKPEVGCLVGNTLDKTKYKTLAQAACAALLDPTCTGFTYRSADMVTHPHYRLRKGNTSEIKGTNVEKGDYSYLKIVPRSETVQRDDL